jgi:arylformamidase
MLDATDQKSGILAELFDLYGRCQVVDLSVMLENDIPRWPTHPPLVIHHTVSHEHDGYFTNTIFMPEHVGTHCDAPAHTHPTMPEHTVDTLMIDAMMGPAAVIDVSSLNLQAGETCGPEVILAWEAANGPIRQGDIVLFNFGWLARHWRRDAEWTYYAKNSPGLTADAVRLLYERGIKALGSDLIACDQAIKDGLPEKSWAHEEYMLPNGKPLIEELTNLDNLPSRCFFIALPLKIKGGSGSPVRAVALVPRG